MRYDRVPGHWGEMYFKQSHGGTLQPRETAQLDGAHKSGEDEVEESGVSGEGGGEGVTSPISSHGLPAGDAVACSPCRSPHTGGVAPLLVCDGGV